MNVAPAVLGPPQVRRKQDPRKAYSQSEQLVCCTEPEGVLRTQEKMYCDEEEMVWERDEKFPGKQKSSRLGVVRRTGVPGMGKGKGRDFSSEHIWSRQSTGSDGSKDEEGQGLVRELQRLAMGTHWVLWRQVWVALEG